MIEFLMHGTGLRYDEAIVFEFPHRVGLSKQEDLSVVLGIHLQYS